MNKDSEPSFLEAFPLLHERLEDKIDTDSEPVPERSLPPHIIVAEYQDRRWVANVIKQCQRAVEESKGEPRKGLIVISGYLGTPASPSYKFRENKEFPLTEWTVPNCVVVMAEVLGERLVNRLTRALLAQGKKSELPENILMSLNQQRLERIQARQQGKR